MTLSLLGIFAAGFVTLFTPCVLPMIPIYLATLVGARTVDESRKSRLLFRALLFSVGFIVVFVFLGFSASFAGGFVAGNRSVFMAVGAVLLLLFALRFLHLIEIPLLDRTLVSRGPDMNRNAQAAKALLLGAAFAAGWSPCIGPVLGAVLTYTALETANPWQGALYLGAFGLGLTTPLMLIAAFADRMRNLLSKAGRWFRPVEVVLGLALLLVAGSMGLKALGAGAGGACPQAPASVVASGAESPSGPGMIFFSSATCPVCQRMKPMVENLAQRCSSYSIAVRTIDVSEPANAHYRDRFHLLGVPTFVFLDSRGRETARLVGEQPESSLLQAASVLAGRPCPGVSVLPPASPSPSGVACDLGTGPSQSRPDGLLETPQCSGG